MEEIIREHQALTSLRKIERSHLFMMLWGDANLIGITNEKFNSSNFYKLKKIDDIFPFVESTTQEDLQQLLNIDKRVIEFNFQTNKITRNQILAIFSIIYKGVLDEKQYDTMIGKMSTCFVDEVLTTVNKPDYTNLIMNSLLFLTVQCNFYKINFIDLFIEEVFNAHGRGGESCALGRAERIVSIHTQVIETLRINLENYKTYNDLQKDTELYELFKDMDEENFIKYKTSTKYFFNELLNLMKPNTYEALSSEDEAIFEDVIIDTNITEVRKKWITEMKWLYKTYTKYKNGEIEISDEIKEISDSKIFESLPILIKNYETKLVEYHKATMLKLEKIYTENNAIIFVAKKSLSLLEEIMQSISVEKDKMIEWMLSIMLRSSPVTREEEMEVIDDFLAEGGNKTKSKSKTKSNSNNDAEIINLIFNNIVLKEIPIEQSEIKQKTVLSYEHIKRLRKYYINRYNPRIKERKMKTKKMKTKMKTLKLKTLK
jgi:hypothetical protein